MLSAWFIVAWWLHIASDILVTIGSGNGVWLFSVKPDPMLTIYQGNAVVFA